MRRLLCAVLSILSLTATASAGELVPAEVDGIDGVYVLELARQAIPPGGGSARDAALAVARELAARHGGVVAAERDLGERHFVVELAAAAAGGLAADPRVVQLVQDRRLAMPLATPRDCQLDQSATLPSPWPANPQRIDCADPTNDVTCVDNWGLDRLDAPAGGPWLDGWNGRPATGRGVHLFFLDSGINPFHEEFLDAQERSRIGSGINFAGDKPSTDFTDCIANSHGTHVAAIAAGRRYGVAKEAVIHPVRVNQCNLFTSSSIVKQGLRWVVDEVARIRQSEGRPVTAVLNVSANWSTSQGVLESWFREVLAAGIVIVNSAGNENALAGLWIPTRIPEVLVVGASNVFDQRWGISPSQPACLQSQVCGSNYGTAVDLFAPGESILSASRQGFRSVCRNTGTSMAAPHVTGAVALYLEKNPTATVQQVTAAILGNAAEGALVGDLGPGSPNRLLSTDVTRPVAKIAATCGANRTCTFQASDCAFAGCSYSWGFGDGSGGTGASVSHTFPRTDSFSVQLTVAGGGGSRTAATTVSPGLFADVPATHPMAAWIERLANAGVTSGCGGGNYCPDSAVTREQVSVFLLVSKLGAGYRPPACTSPMFTDVPCSHPFAAWINDLAVRGITGGCGGGNYCPGGIVSREQMAVLLLRTRDQAFSPPACMQPPFTDVPCSNPFAPWIAALAAEGIAGGCAPGRYCPGDPVTRAQMAVFLVLTFDLP